MRDRMLLVSLVGLGLAAAGELSAESVALAPNTAQVERWNRFADEIHVLHRRQLEGVDVKETSRVGGYYRWPEFYREVQYQDAKTGRLLSVIQWEREKAGNIHSIQVYVHDAGGRVTRDFLAWYLPFARNAPIGTFINLHAYHGELHAYRQFDASDNLIYENCRGRYGGEAVTISLDEFALIREERAPAVTAAPAYRACFASLPASAGVYLRPQ